MLLYVYPLCFFLTASLPFPLRSFPNIWFPFDLVVGDGWCRLGPRKADSKGRFGPRKGNTCHSHLAFLGYCLYTCTQVCPTLPVLFSYIPHYILCFSFMLLPYSPFMLLYLFLYEAFLIRGLLLTLWLVMVRAVSGPER